MRSLLLPHAVEVGARLCNFGAQRVHRGLHRRKCLALEVGDRVHGLVDVAESLLQPGDVDSAAGRLLVDRCTLVAQHLAGAGDQIAGGGVQCADLVEHQLLIGQCLRHDHRCAQRADRCGRCAVHALAEFEVVLADQVKRQIPLNVDAHLREKVGHLLARVEQHFLTHHPRLLRVACVECSGLAVEFGIELPADVDVLLQSLHQAPEVGLLLFDGRVVAQQFVLAALERLDDGVEVTLAALVAVEVVGKPVAHRDDAQKLARREEVALTGGIELLDLAAQVDEALADLGSIVEEAVVEALHRPVEHPVGNRCRGLDVLVAHGMNARDGILELRALAVVRGDVVDELTHLGIERSDVLGLEPHASAGRFRRYRRHRLRRLQREVLRRRQGLLGGDRVRGGLVHRRLLSRQG